MRKFTITTRFIRSYAICVVQWEVPYIFRLIIIKNLQRHNNNKDYKSRKYQARHEYDFCFWQIHIYIYMWLWDLNSKIVGRSIVTYIDRARKNFINIFFIISATCYSSVVIIFATLVVQKNQLKNKITAHIGPTKTTAIQSERCKFSLLVKQTKPLYK